MNWKKTASASAISAVDKSEIRIFIDEIKVSAKNGGNPKYSIKMLWSYCREHSRLRRIVQQITDLFPDGSSAV